MAKQTTITYRDLTIQKENRVVHRGNEVIELTKRIRVAAYFNGKRERGIST